MYIQAYYMTKKSIKMIQDKFFNYCISLLIKSFHSTGSEEI